MVPMSAPTTADGGASASHQQPPTPAAAQRCSSPQLHITKYERVRPRSGQRSCASVSATLHACAETAQQPSGGSAAHRRRTDLPSWDRYSVVPPACRTNRRNLARLVQQHACRARGGCRLWSRPVGSCAPPAPRCSVFRASFSSNRSKISSSDQSCHAPPRWWGGGAGDHKQRAS